MCFAQVDGVPDNYDHNEQRRHQNGWMIKYPIHSSCTSKKYIGHDTDKPFLLVLGRL